MLFGIALNDYNDSITLEVEHKSQCGALYLSAAVRARESSKPLLSFSAASNPRSLSSEQCVVEKAFILIFSVDYVIYLYTYIQCEATIGCNGTRFSPLLRKGVCLSQTRGCAVPWFSWHPPRFVEGPFRKTNTNTNQKKPNNGHPLSLLYKAPHLSFASGF